MDMTGERRIPAPRERVWSALNDPDILKACIPGCDKLERTAENEFTASAGVKIGPISARFAGKVQLSDIEPPTSYTISGEGQGGVAGFAKGGAAVRLADAEAGATVLTYDVKAQVGGKIAQLGARLIDASAKQMADQFFDRFSARVGADASAAALPGAVVLDTTQIAAAPTGAAGIAARPGELTPMPMPTANAPIAAPLATPLPTPLATPLARPSSMPTPPASISVFSLLPKQPLGMPLVFWIGSVLFLFVLLLIFGNTL